MPMAISEQHIFAIIAALSPARLGTYLNAKGFSASATVLDIYVWNALVSSAMFASLHICEVVVRNGASQALELKYGANWPWEVGFERTLSSWGKRELQLARHRKQLGAAGRVVADLSLGFWGHLFTAGRINTSGFHICVRYFLVRRFPFRLKASARSSMRISRCCVSFAIELHTTSQSSLTLS